MNTTHLFGRIACLLLCAALPAALLAGCGGSHQKFQTDFYDVFDTYTSLTIYAKNEAEFHKYADIIHAEMQRLHQLYDIYNDYDGINNLKLVNDSAGITPVQVDPSILALLAEGQRAYDDSGGTVNIAMGAVLRIWHDYRTAGLQNPATAALPPMEELRAASAHTGISDLILDEKTSSVYLRDPMMSLDVGALAKGYAVQLAVDKARDAGMASGLVSAGGNVSVVGAPLDGREAWSVGIQSPIFTEDGSQPLYDTVHATDMAVVSSGDYQRFYMVDGQSYHHIIDPETLLPATRFLSITVLHPDSGVADMLSTAVFLLPEQEGLQLVNSYGAECLWILPDQSHRATRGYTQMSQAAQ